MISPIFYTSFKIILDFNSYLYYNKYIEISNQLKVSIMLELLSNYEGKLKINNVEYENIKEAQKAFKDYKGGLTIILNENQRKTVHDIDTDIKFYQITVKKWMTTYDESFFLEEYNEDGPMPFVTMVGFKLGETKNLIKMRLRADLITNKSTICMRCGRPLSNPISQYLSLGPECGAKEHMQFIESGMDIKQVQEDLKKKLREVVWEGWIVKSAITKAIPLPDYEK